MITIELIDGRFCPIATCDRCGQRITDIAAETAVVEWSMDANLTHVTRWRIVHKAAQCPRRITNAQRLEDHRLYTYWNELQDVLQYFAQNVGTAIPAGDPTACFECGATPDANHHVVPRSLGGNRTLPLCANCHSLIHSPGQTISLGRLAQISKRRLKDGG